jgi:GNAT superfamily N-acetyltransferase
MYGRSLAHRRRRPRAVALRSDLPVDSWLPRGRGRAARGRLVGCGRRLAVGIGESCTRARRARGLGRQLADRSEARARERGVRRIHQFVLGGDPAATRLFLDRGYREVRRFYEMAIDLDREPPPPSGSRRARARDAAARGARSFFEALDEAFQDHWGTPFSAVRAVVGAASLRPRASICALVPRSETAARSRRPRATRRTERRRRTSALSGPPSWRGRGLGRALLLHAFREFHAAESLAARSGSTRRARRARRKLYESVGMTRRAVRTSSTKGRSAEHLRAKCPDVPDADAVAVEPGYECHACGRTFARLVRVPRAWGGRR